MSFENTSVEQCFFRVEEMNRYITWMPSLKNEENLPAEMPRIAHFRFSHEGVALLWRKLDRYQRNKRAAAEEPRDGGRRKDDGTALKLSGRFATHVKGYAEQCKLFSASGEGDVRPSPASDGFWFSNSSIAGIRATCRRETAGLAQC